jgi:hypothetical protein
MDGDTDEEASQDNRYRERDHDGRQEVLEHS